MNLRELLRVMEWRWFSSLSSDLVVETLEMDAFAQRGCGGEEGFELNVEAPPVLSGEGGGGGGMEIWGGVQRRARPGESSHQV